MPKPRRKSEIRTAVLLKCATFREVTEARAAFLKLKPRSWHDAFLTALLEGIERNRKARPIGWIASCRCSLFHFNEPIERFNAEIISLGILSFVQKNWTCYRH